MAHSPQYASHDVFPSSSPHPMAAAADTYAQHRSSPPASARHDSAAHTHEPGPSPASQRPASPFPHPSPGSRAYPLDHRRPSAPHGAPLSPGPTLIQHLRHPPHHQAHPHPQAHPSMQAAPAAESQLYPAYPPASIQLHNSSPLVPWDPHFHQPQPYDYGPADGAPKRRAVRAAQACENCRTKKAKCDEARPVCGNCTQNQVKCEYPSRPPQKQDRSLLQLNDSIIRLADRMQEIEGFLHQRLDHLLALQAPGPHPANAAVSVKSVTSPNTVAASSHSSLEFSQTSAAGPHISTQWDPYEAQYASIQRDASDLLVGDLGIPRVHSTAAHDLRNWPRIKGFFTGISPTYVKLGENHHHLDLSQHTEETCPVGLAHPRNDSKSALVDAQDARVLSSFSDARPGGAFKWSPSTQNDIDYQHSPGGRDADGSLSLDRGTLLGLLDSYIRNIHILQPFMTRQWLDRKVQSFVDRYCSDDEDCFDGSNSTNGAKRRKLSRGFKSESSDRDNRSATKLPIRRTVDNAVLLLIFALGKISEHEGPLPRPGHQAAQHPPTEQGFPQQYYGVPDANGDAPYRPSEAGERWSHNIDSMPGAAYFAHAVSILGEVLGGNTIVHVQAHLLAGLYMAQLVHVYDSWKWINAACVAWLMLFKNHDEKPETLSDEEVLVYWACLICESDILAELELIPSGISKLEDQIPVTSGGGGLDADSQAIHIYYNAQMMIRKILNRSHSALYDPDKKNQDKKGEPNEMDPGRNRGPKWSQMNSEQLSDQLERWRKALPNHLKWDNDDPPANNINCARLRGKYWGARNIIFRPFLHRTVNGITPEELAAQADYEDIAFKSAKLTFEYAGNCIEACRNSTIAFDNVPGMKQRLIVTNIFGTAHAQFGNMLVLGAACLSPCMGPQFPKQQLLPLLERTKLFLSYLAPLSPTMATNLVILDNVEQRVRAAIAAPA